MEKIHVRDVVKEFDTLLKNLGLDADLDYHDNFQFMKISVGGEHKRSVHGHEIIPFLNGVRTFVECLQTKGVIKAK